MEVGSVTVDLTIVDVLLRLCRAGLIPAKMVKAVRGMSDKVFVTTVNDL